MNIHIYIYMYIYIYIYIYIYTYKYVGIDSQGSGVSSSSSNNPIISNQDRSMPRIKGSDSPARRGSSSGQSGPTGAPGGTRIHICIYSVSENKYVSYMYT
jgi:hypothetical protein